jgi:hypothetical protein
MRDLAAQDHLAEALHLRPGYLRDVLRSDLIELSGVSDETRRSFSDAPMPIALR